MINSVELENFGPLPNLHWQKLAKINLIIGANGCGKTFLLKAMYSGMRVLEGHRRGHDQRSAAEILADKLYWTFQQDKIGDLVRKGADGALSCKMKVDGRAFSYRFGKDTTKSISSLENDVPPRASNSVFLPPKEVLSLQKVILKSRMQDQDFGFDDTYFDLAQALTYTTTRGKNYAAFAESRTKLEEILKGKIELDEKKQIWQFKNTRNQKFEIGVTAEGIKKIAIMDTLLGNRYLSDDSVVFIDEPESALHPKAIEQFMEIIGLLAARGVQFFIASHSYFVIKKLFLLAQEKDISIPVLSEEDDAWRQADLKQGMPDNPIIAESVSLYRKEVELTLG
jgi:AAA15 family ATPase/GTPase